MKPILTALLAKPIVTALLATLILTSTAHAADTFWGYQGVWKTRCLNFPKGRTKQVEWALNSTNYFDNVIQISVWNCKTRRIQQIPVYRKYTGGSVVDQGKFYLRLNGQSALVVVSSGGWAVRVR